jgi:succinate dehydrogenase / fumarate reductase flavoprotein subunit
MWEGVGVVRSGAGLDQALGQLADIRRRAAASPAGAGDLPAALDLRSMLVTAEATVRSALLRTESRGAHQRSDYPQLAPEWQRTIVAQPIRTDDGPHTGISLTTAELRAPSPEVAAALDEAELELTGRLLE